MAQAFLNVTQTHETKNDTSLSLLIERKVTEVDVPEGTVLLGPYCFAYCNKLERISIPEGVHTIRPFAFYNAAIAGGELVLPKSCAWLYANALSTTNFTCMRLGNLILIQAGAFSNNPQCMIYDFTRNTSVPTMNGSNVFGGINANAKIFVPAHLYDAWIVATNWVEWADHIVPVDNAPEVSIPEHVSRGLAISRKGNGKYEVTGRGECTDSVVVITDECADGPIDNIADAAFLYDGDIEELFIMGSVESIANTVCNVSALKRLYMENVKEVLSIAFICNNLEYVRFSSNIQYIGGNSFVSSGSRTVYDFTAFTGDSIPVLEWEAMVPGSTLSPEKILVPIDRYNEWRSATNWSYYADKIFPAK